MMGTTSVRSYVSLLWSDSDKNVGNVDIPMIKKVCALIILASLLYACDSTAPVQPTIDVAAIHTAAAETVIAEFTETARVLPSIPTATATQYFTVTPESVTQPVIETTTFNPNELLESTPTGITCDDAKWAADVTVPDGTEMTPGQDFVKTWKIKNTGSCTWGTGYTIIHGYDEKMEGIAEPLSTVVSQGEEVEVSVRFKAPDGAGEHRSYWRMQNASGSTFGEFFYVSIVVR